MLRYQILVCNEEFVFHVHAAAIKLRSCAERAAHSFVIRFRTTIFTACANGTDEQVFRRVERRDVLDDRYLIALSLQLECTHAVGQHIIEPRLENAVTGQRFEAGHGILIEQFLVTAGHARDVFRSGAERGRKGKIGRNIAGMERNDSGNVFRC